MENLTLAQLKQLATTKGLSFDNKVTKSELLFELNKLIPKQLGRPTNPNSTRQLQLAEIERRRAAGEVKRGRPINPDSPRQQQLAIKGTGTGKRGRPVVEGSAHAIAKAMRKEREEAGWVSTGKRGRPTVENSDRQKKIAERLERISQGFEIKPGRPKISEHKITV